MIKKYVKEVIAEVYIWDQNNTFVMVNDVNTLMGINHRPFQGAYVGVEKTDNGCKLGWVKEKIVRWCDYVR